MNREIVTILSDIRSVHNVGSIFRTADGAGVKKIYLCGTTPTPLDRLGHMRKDFAKVALGAEVVWEYRVSISTLIKQLKTDGFEICAVEQAPKAISYRAYAPSTRCVAFVLGNEIKGISQSALSLADVVIEIPMHGRKESLNVAVAFGIIAYYFASHKFVSGNKLSCNGVRSRDIL